MRITLLLAWLALPSITHGADLALPRGCGQIVLVTSSSWDSPSAVLQRYSFDRRTGAWERVGRPMPAIVGERGLGWGLGLLPQPDDGWPRKVEGDRRAPAGVFRLGEAFGTRPREKLGAMKVAYRPITPALEAVDDPASRHYNQIVDRSRIARPDWRSSERMAAIPAYKLGLVVAHNDARRPGAGSCIFIHLRLRGDHGTAGCTALHEAELLTLLRWLDPARHPVLVQLPRQVAHMLAPWL